MKVLYVASEAVPFAQRAVCLFVNKKVLQKGVKKVSTFNTQ